ncbi:MAG TPA: nucleotidyltransferase domain-containing protein [Mycobacterium sp.]|jgi:predicted nucleotidyltransferase|nr:nucleotidyltransferase domain-containing protein [Mycobacterium sp.]HUH70677.1 nucleotidyltransferase domain-containing protein [Mycobacterium sp.]
MPDGSRDDAIESLTTLGLDNHEVQLIETELPAGTKALMVYGSRARGDHQPQSDFDILRLSDEPHITFKLGRVAHP